MPELQQLYLNKNFKEAIEKLLELKDQYSDSVFHFNLGTLHAKAGNYAAGRYHLEKSLHEGGLDTGILNNLAYVKSKLGLGVLEESSRWLDQVQVFLTEIPASFYEAFSLLGLILVFLFFFFKKIKSLMWLTCLTILFLSPWGLSKLYVEGLKPVVVLEEAKVYEGPSQVFSVAKELPAGLKLIVKKDSSGWYFIETPLQFSGWVKPKSLGFLK